MSTGWNLHPERPDPFALALALGYSRDPEGWDIGLAMQRAASNPDHRRLLEDAHVQRYGVGWDTPGPLGAEHETNIWPRVLQALFGGFPSAREVHDAAFFGTKSMVVEAWQKLGVPGYVMTKPQRIVPGDPVFGFGLTGFPDPEPRVYMVPSKAEKDEPGWFANYRDSVWGGTMYYQVEKRPGTVTVVPVPNVPTPSLPDARDMQIADLKAQLNDSLVERNSAVLWRTKTEKALRVLKAKLPNRGGGKYVLATKELLTEILGE